MSHVQRDDEQPDWLSESWAKLPSGWTEILQRFFSSEPGIRLVNFLSEELGQDRVLPPLPNMFRALEYVETKDVRVVILGQDPYHGPGQADGLAFSVPHTVKPPPSLRNILRELKEDTRATRLNPDLSDWAEQGVLLLNTTLTVRESLAGSHRGQGWEALTDLLIQAISQSKNPSVFVLWGKDAAQKSHLIDPARHLILSSPHPSPLSAYRGFFGSRPFSRSNEFLASHGRRPVKW